MAIKLMQVREIFLNKAILQMVNNYSTVSFCVRHYVGNKMASSSKFFVIVLSSILLHQFQKNCAILSCIETKRKEREKSVERQTEGYNDDNV